MKLVEDGFFKRNKKIILISLIIFLAFAVIGVVIGNISSGDNVGKITEAMKNATENGTVNKNADLGLSSINLFAHNLMADLIIILGGFLFSILSVIVVVLNAVSIGSIFGFDLVFSLVSVLPHSIIEYAATVLALTCAFLITKLEIRIIKKRDFKNTIKESKTELKDIFALVIVIIVLLAIAAIVEAHITPMILNWYYF